MAILDGGLLPASFRGVPFAVTNSDVAGGRRIALHEYAGRDDPWAEDMGRRARRWRFRGFLVEGDAVFAGGPIQLQRVLLLAALEKKGAGLLTHPTLGLLQASVASFSIGEALDGARVSSVDIEFVEAGKQGLISLLSSSSGLFSASNIAIAALAVDGVRAVALASAADTRSSASVTAAVWSAQTVQLANDATALYRLAAQLPGSYGRFANGGNAGLHGQAASAYDDATTIADLTAIASERRTAARTAAYALADTISAANLAYAGAVPTAIVTLVQSLADACADPRDAIRLLLTMIAFAPSRAEAQFPLGLAIDAMFRRAAASVLTKVVGICQLASADDAAQLATLVGEALDGLATAAADAGDDQTYAGLRQARVAVIQDLRARGATLAQIKLWRSPQATPALVLAQRFYRDASRADQLVSQAQPVHPLFMPTAFSALAA